MLESLVESLKGAAAAPGATAALQGLTSAGASRRLSLGPSGPGTRGPSIKPSTAQEAPAAAPGSSGQGATEPRGLPAAAASTAGPSPRSSFHALVSALKQDLAGGQLGDALGRQAGQTLATPAPRAQHAAPGVEPWRLSGKGARNQAAQSARPPPSYIRRAPGLPEHLEARWETCRESRPCYAEGAAASRHHRHTWHPDAQAEERHQRPAPGGHEATVRGGHEAAVCGRPGRRSALAAIWAAAVVLIFWLLLCLEEPDLQFLLRRLPSTTQTAGHPSQRHEMVIGPKWKTS